MRSSPAEHGQPVGATALPVPPAATPRAAGPVGLVLAAGAGRRLGRGPKALLRIDGVALVQRLVDALLGGGCRHVVVVTGASTDQVAALLQDLPDVRLVHHAAWTDGMGTSLRRGLAAIDARSDVLVTPVDRPGISAAQVARIIAAHAPGRITAAGHRDPDGRLRRGHPVLFDARWTAAAAVCAHGEVGARRLLADHPDALAVIDCTDLDDGTDIDVPADLERWLRPAGVPGASGRVRM